MVKNIEEKNTPGRGPLADHVNVFTKSFVIIGCINGRKSVAFNIIIQPYSFTTYNLFKIVPVPFSIGRPVFGQILNNNWFQWQIVTLLKIFYVDGVNAVNR